MTGLESFTVTALMTAINVALYVADTAHWWNLASAVFCGLCCLASIALTVTR